LSTVQKKEEGKCQGKGHVNIEGKARICKGEVKREIRGKTGGEQKHRKSVGCMRWRTAKPGSIK
jgi:RecJ-like exonuclease